MNVYLRIALMLVRLLLASAGGALVSRGWLEQADVDEAAGGLALLVVTGAWAIWQINRDDLYRRALAVLGLQAPPTTPVSVLEAAALATVKDPKTRREIPRG